jgi:hypothetical protein
MPSTYSTNQGLELIATGEQSGTWGSSTNNNLEIVDRVLSGVGTIDLSASAAAHTLTTTDGTLSDGQYKVLVFTGATEDCTVTIDPNNQGKLYFVDNNSGYTLTFSQGSGANVTVTNGDTKVIYADGGGATAAVIDFTSTLEITSVNITGGSIDGTPIGATTKSTGAFNVVDIDGGTGSNIDNTDIGSTTPKSGSFTTFTVNASGSTFTVAPVSGVGTLDNTNIGATTRGSGAFTTINANSNATISGNLQVDGNVDLGSDGSDTVTINGLVDSDILPTGTRDLGSSSAKFQDLHLDGIAYVDDIHAADCDIDGGTIDNTVIGGTTAAAGTFTTVNATSVTTGSISAGNFYELQTSPAQSGTTFTCNANDGSMFVCNHGNTSGATFAFTNVPSTGRVYTATIIHEYTGGSAMSSMSFPSGTEWPNATQPSPPGPGETDIYTLFTYDGGTSWYAGLSGANFGEPS